MPRKSTLTENKYAVVTPLITIRIVYLSDRRINVCVADNFYSYTKDYCITGRANGIFCAVGLR